MAKFKKGDLVVWKPANKDISPIYAVVDRILEPPAANESYILASMEVRRDGIMLTESYEFWEHELDFVDTKGANI